MSRTKPFRKLTIMKAMEAKEVNEEKRMQIRDYYAKKLEEELERLDREGILDEKKLKELRTQHFRTPYIY